jgi:flagellar motility protein MotE (MotC chaperone)
VALAILGAKRDEIAGDLDIGKGTVSEIIMQYSRKDSEVGLIRQVALAIKNLQTDVSTFSQALRLKISLDKLELEEEKIESLISVADVHCFKRGLEIGRFFEIVENVTSYSNKMGIPLEDLPAHIKEQLSSLEEIRSEIADAQSNLSSVLRDNDVTLSVLEDYKKDKPFIDTLVETQLELNKVTKERDDLINQLLNEKSEKITRKYEWMMPEHELEEANRLLIIHNSAPIELTSSIGWLIASSVSPVST